MPIPTDIDYKNYNPSGDVVSDEIIAVPATAPFQIFPDYSPQKHTPSSIELWTGTSKTGTQYTEKPAQVQVTASGDFYCNYNKGGQLTIYDDSASLNLYFSYNGEGTFVRQKLFEDTKDTTGSGDFSDAGGNINLIDHAKDNTIHFVNGSGDVKGPSSSADNALVVYDGISGRKIKDSNIIVSATDVLQNISNPIASGDAANKDYVDKAISGIEFTYYLTDTNSDIATYFRMQDIETGEAESSHTSSALSAGNDQLLFNFATPVNEPAFFDLVAAIYDCHFHVEKSGGIAKTVNLYWKLFERETDTTETEIMQSETSAEVGGKTSFDLHAALANDYALASGSRLVWKLYANVSGGGATAQVVLYQEGTSDSHLSVKTTSGALSDIFLRQDGTTPLTGDMGTNGYKFTGLPMPSASGDSANKQYVDNNVGAVDNHSGTHHQGSGDAIDLTVLAPPSGDVGWGGNKITDLASPTVSGDAANRSWVNAVSGDITDDINARFMQDLVDDTTPQLGGDLDLNGNNIDFPSTPNIDDCFDEDDMASDSPTGLSTQQSIKAYVDNSGGGGAPALHAGQHMSISGDRIDMSTMGASGDVNFHKVIASGDIWGSGEFAIQGKYIVCSDPTSAGIQSCINRIGSEGTVVLPPVDHAITSKITFPGDNINLVGLGWGSHLDASVWSTDHVIDLNGKDYCKIKNLKITGNTGGGHAKDLIYGASSLYTEIAGCYLLDADEMAIYLDIDSDYANIHHNLIINPDDNGVFIKSGANSHVDYNTIQNCGTNFAITLFGSPDSTANGNILAASAGGIALSNSSHNSIANSNTIDNCTTGISVNSCNDCSVNGNTIVDGAKGIDAPVALRLTATGNTISSVTQNAIKLRLGAHNSVLGGNVISGGTNTFDDILIDGTDSGIISNNKLLGTAGNAERGISLVTSDKWMISNNQSEGHDTAGIELDANSDSNQVLWNHLEDETVPVIDGGNSNVVINASGGHVNFGGHRIGNLATPLTSGEAANAGYVNDASGDIVGSISTPIFWNMLTVAPDVVGQGTWVRSVAAGSLYNGQFFNSTAADGDNYTVNFRCPAGTYTSRFNVVTFNNQGIIDFYIDGNEEGSFDSYAVAPGSAIVINETSSLVLSTGVHTVKFQIDGKNGASSGYNSIFQGVNFQRTA